MPDDGAGSVRPGAPHLPMTLVVALLLASAYMLAPYWSWLVLAIWVGQFGRKLVPGVARSLGGRQRAAALLTAALIAIIVIPLGLLVWKLVIDAIDLTKRLMESPEARDIFEKLVGNGNGNGAGGAPAGAGAGSGTGGETEPVEVIVKHSGRAWSLVMMILGIAAKVVIGLFIFLSVIYAILADGPRAYRWFEDHLPLDRRITRRLADAFSETGRGLFIGVGGAGLAQSIVATICYLALGVPDALVLGLLTLMGSVIPSIGTGIVWVPVTVGLALTGRTTEAFIMGGVGVLVIGLIDNLLRPILSRRGHLALPSILIMVSMFGGLAVMGAAGLIAGPLVLRLAKEVLLIHRENRADDPGGAIPSGVHAAIASGPITADHTAVSAAPVPVARDVSDRTAR